MHVLKHYFVVVVVGGWGFLSEREQGWAPVCVAKAKCGFDCVCDC